MLTGISAVLKGSNVVYKLILGLIIVVLIVFLYFHFKPKPKPIIDVIIGATTDEITDKVIETVDTSILDNQKQEETIHKQTEVVHSTIKTTVSRIQKDESLNKEQQIKKIGEVQIKELHKLYENYYGGTQ